MKLQNEFLALEFDGITGELSALTNRLITHETLRAGLSPTAGGV